MIEPIPAVGDLVFLRGPNGQGMVTAQVTACTKGPSSAPHWLGDVLNASGSVGILHGLGARTVVSFGEALILDVLRRRD